MVQLCLDAAGGGSKGGGGAAGTASSSWYCARVRGSGRLPLQPTLQGLLLGYPLVYVVHSRQEAEAASRVLAAAGLRLHRALAPPAPGGPLAAALAALEAALGGEGAAGAAAAGGGQAGEGPAGGGVGGGGGGGGGRRKKKGGGMAAVLAALAADDDADGAAGDTDAGEGEGRQTGAGGASGGGGVGPVGRSAGPRPPPDRDLACLCAFSVPRDLAAAQPEAVAAAVRGWSAVLAAATGAAGVGPGCEEAAVVDWGRGGGRWWSGSWLEAEEHATPCVVL